MFANLRAFRSGGGRMAPKLHIPNWFPISVRSSGHPSMSFTEQISTEHCTSVLWKLASRYRSATKLFRYDEVTPSVTLESGEIFSADLVVAADGKHRHYMLAELSTDVYRDQISRSTSD